MSYIKKTNIIKTREPLGFVKTVKCPYCNTFLEPVPSYVTAMLCWHCGKEFRIEQDSEKWESSYADRMHTVVRSAIV